MKSLFKENYLDLNKVSYILVLVLIFIGAMLVPTFLEELINLGKYKQLIIGTIVNISLITTALYVKGNIKTILISTLPSVSTICSGLLFGGITMYSKVMIPFIWTGNFILVLLYKYLFLRKNKNYFLSGMIAVICKVAIIYLGFVLLSNLLSFPSNVKNALSISMGIYQFYTGTSAVIITSLLKKNEIKKEVRKIKKIISGIIIVLIGVLVFLLVNYLIHKNDCCSCCSSGEICIAVCCKCEGAIFD